jgi:hypothetical protein
MSLFSFFGCSKSKGTLASSNPQQTVSLPSVADLDRLAKQRAVIEKFLADDQSRAKYAKPAGKLGTLRGLLAQKAFKPTQTYELQCMGVVLGDALVQEMGMEWIMVEDDVGSDPAVRMPGTSIIIFPLTMISKRVERGEAVDVFDLFNATAAQIEDLQKTSK